MTCVVGLRGEHGVLLAFDSLSAAGSEVVLRRDPKGAQINSEVAVGYTYSYRYGQIVAHHLQVGVVEGDEFDWAVTVFVPALRSCLAEHGWLKKDSEREESGQLILAVRGRLFVVESDNAVTEPAGRYACIGSGGAVARGAIEGLARAKVALKDEEIARVALETAAELNAFVRPPWHFLSTGLAGCNGKARGKVLVTA